MITYSVIQKSQLESAHRLDAEYYQPEYLDIQKRLSTSSSLIELSERITDFGAYSQMNFVEYTSSGVRFLRNQDVGEVFVDDSDPIFISLETYKKLSLKLNEYDVITPRVGTLGNAAVVLKKRLPVSANQNLAQIKPNLSKIDPFYLAVFLCSHFGRKQFERFATGNVQPWLNLIQIKSLKVFVPSVDEQNIIRSIAIRSVEKYENSKSFYSQAENLLLEELELKDFKLKDDLSCVVNLSDTKTIHRLDAEYFQPKYEKILSRIQKKFKIIKLSDLVSMKKGIEIGSEAYQEEGKPFIRVSNLSKQGFTEREQKYLDETLYQKLKEDFEPKIGEILLTKDATPGIAYVLKEVVEGIVASGILRLKPKEPIENEYLALVINSIVGKSQVERDTGGSVIVHWRPKQIKNCLIPILPKSTQQKISSLVRQSHESRRKAKQFLEEAKRKVEEMIERGSD